MVILEKLNIKTDNEKLYETAFTHTSFSNEHEDVDNYERLEFLGDAVLELIISDYLFNEKHLEEGTMTKMRSSYVCEEACATYADDLEFSKYIRLGSGEIEANETIMADVFESFIGAMYLDKGFAFTSDIVMAIIKKYINNGIDFLHDYKSELQELVQTGNKSVVYEVVDEKGPAHDKTFTSQVKVGNVVMGKGVGTSKKSAEQAAAKEALSKQVK
ncbi:MAG: ribonuclease III [Bacilli bacterium]|nr:ribonuclease III [Bacilli bacterium]